MEASSRSSEPLDPVWRLVAFGRGGVKLAVLLLFLMPSTLGELRGGLGKHGYVVHHVTAVNKLCADSNAGLGCPWVSSAPFPWVSVGRAQPRSWVVLSRQERVVSQLLVFIRRTLCFSVLNVVRETVWGAGGCRNIERCNF